MAQFQTPIAHEALVKHLAVNGASLLRLAEALGEVGADQGRSCTAGQCLDRHVDVVDPAVGAARDERIEARLEQASSVRTGQPGLSSNGVRLRRASLGQFRQLARRDGGDEKRHERDPILRVRDRQRVDGR